MNMLSRIKAELAAWENQPPSEYPATLFVEWLANLLKKPGTEGEVTRPRSWGEFLAAATAVFVAKNTDYDSRFMRALIDYRKRGGYEAARTIWAWEVEKKLDRCRTWLKRGELLVQDEGIENSVQDLFIYTVQYAIFLDANTGYRQLNPLHELTEANFYAWAAKYGPQDWINFLATEGLIDLTDCDDKQLALLLAREMTGGANG